MIEPLSANADESPPVMGGGHSELKTETYFQNMAHPLAASPSSPDIIEQGQSSSHLLVNNGGIKTTCHGLSRGSRVKTICHGLSIGSRVKCSATVGLTGA